MKVTRDVIYDLLPAYFSGDVSADTRALIEEFMETDPEFKRMSDRFRTLFDENRRADSAGDADAFQRTRTVVQRTYERRTLAIAYGLAAVFAATVAVLRDREVGLDTPGFVIAIVFGGVAVASWLSGLRSTHTPSQS